MIRGSGLMPYQVPFVIALVFSVAIPRPAAAQLVRGYVMESDTGRPLGAARVALTDSAGTVLGVTESGIDGAFQLEVPEPGSYMVTVQRFGYRSETEGPFEVGRDRDAGVAFRLVPQPLPLDEVLAEVDRRDTNQYLEEEGFYHRQKARPGFFLGPEKIREIGAFGFRDLARRIPFARFEFFGGGGGLLLKSRNPFADAYCAPTVYVDGHRQVGAFDLDAYLIPDDLLAVEVYRGDAQSPMEWFAPQGCGVVLIWSRWGR